MWWYGLMLRRRLKTLLRLGPKFTFMREQLHDFLLSRYVLALLSFSDWCLVVDLISMPIVVSFEVITLLSGDADIVMAKQIMLLIN